MLLGVYGADVIKVEPPEGDWSRFLGTTYGSHTTLSAVYNRGKRSLCLDMKHKDGIAIAGGAEAMSFATQSTSFGSELDTNIERTNALAESRKLDRKRSAKALTVSCTLNASPR